MRPQDGPWTARPTQRTGRSQSRVHNRPKRAHHTSTNTSTYRGTAVSTAFPQPAATHAASIENCHVIRWFWRRSTRHSARPPTPPIPRTFTLLGVLGTGSGGRGGERQEGNHGERTHWLGGETKDAGETKEDATSGFQQPHRGARSLPALRTPVCQDIRGVPTAITQTLYADKVFVVISQTGAFGSMVRPHAGAPSFLW